MKHLYWLLIAVLLNTSALARTAAPQSVTLTPTDDRDNWGPNPGNNATVNASEYSYAYFRFNLSSVSAVVNRAIFRVYRASSDPIDLKLYYASSDSWNENDNASLPDFGRFNDAEPNLILNRYNSTENTYELDVTAAVAKAYADDKLVTLVIRKRTGGWTPFNAKESATNQPALIVETGDTDTAPPTAPTSLITSNITRTRIGLAWRASADNVGVTTYELFRNGASVGITTATNYTFADLALNTAYALSVKAKDAAGNVSEPGSVTATTLSNASLLTLTPTDDRDSWAPNAGSLSTVNASQYNTAYYRFDLSSTIDTVKKATLRLYANGGNATLRADLYLGLSDNWTEGSTTGLPALSADVVASKPVPGAGYVEFDVSRFVTLEKLKGDKIITFALRTNIGSWTAFNAKEAATNKPELVLDDAERDAQSPAAPTNLQANAVGATSLQLTWTDAVDDLLVVEYDVLQNGTKLGTTQLAQFQVGNLSSDTGYSFSVVARDISGKTGAPATLSVKTKRLSDLVKANKIGLSLSAESIYNDIAKHADRLQALDASGNALDNAPALNAQGWPTQDFQLILLDKRPTGYWWEPSDVNGGVDDPDLAFEDISGTYQMSFDGQAEVSSALSPAGFAITDKTYDAGRNRTTATFTVKSMRTGIDNGIIGLKFRNLNGFNNLSIVKAGTSGRFNPAFLSYVTPFSILRFMDFTATNITVPELFNGPNPTDLVKWEWNDRTRPEDARYDDGLIRQATNPDKPKKGLPWEDVVAISNQTDAEPWINIPVTASDDYIRQLARLFRDNLQGNKPIYIEHSNELWNFAFGQYVYNKNKAKQEAETGDVIGADGNRDEQQLVLRRHVRRLIRIGKIFEEEFGSGSLITRIRPVLAWWTIKPDEYKTMLDWAIANKTALGFTNINEILYGIASDGYYTPDENTLKTAGIADLIQAFQKKSAALAPEFKHFKELADGYGLKYTAYEGGPGDNINLLDNRDNRIRAARNPGMYGTIQAGIADNWFRNGGDVYIHFASTTNYSRYGQWGASWDFAVTNAPKYKALVDMAAPGTALLALDGTAPSAPTNITAVGKRPSGWVLNWTPSTDASGVWLYHVVVNGDDIPATVTPANSATLTGLTDGTTYQIQVFAFDRLMNRSAAGSFSFTPVTPPATLKVQYADGDNAPGNNQIKPNLRLVNEGTEAVPYGELTVRYWFTAEQYASINTWIDYAQLGNGNITMKYVRLEQPRAGADGYLEYSFKPAAGNLAAGGNSGPIQSRAAKQDWTNLNETDDYSFASGTNYALTTKVTLYRTYPGEPPFLIWGTEPETVPTVRKLTVQTENKNSKTDGNTISTYLKLTNEGNVPVAYKDLTVRYWFTAEGMQALNHWIDFAQLGSNKIRGKFVRLATPSAGADTYFELAIDSTLGSLQPQSSTGNIQYRLAKTDWSAFNETNDYSYKVAASFANNDRVTVYYKGALVYGTEPAASGGRLGATETGEFQLQVGISPNPAPDGRLHITVRGAEGQPVRLQLTNLTGQVVTEQAIPQAGPTETVDWTISAQPTGLYLLRATTPTHVKSVKVVR